MSHVFSMNCKVDSVCGELTTDPGLDRAVGVFRKFGVKRVWLEVYRNRTFADFSTLKRIRDRLERDGFSIGGVIVATRMSDRAPSGWASETCYTDPTALERMQAVVRRSAALFDRILFDDFLFTNCTCKFCEEARGPEDRTAFRVRLLRDFIERGIVLPARAARPDVKLIIKYPCWYESYHQSGYDLIGSNGLFDATWAGNETRNPTVPPSKAWWIQRWLSEFGPCEGGWYDPLSCSPEIYVEQARNTILGGAPESLLHCYDYLFLSGDAVAQDGGGLQVVADSACADSLYAELDGLNTLAELLEGMRPYGVATFKKPNCDASCEHELPLWFNLCGIPIVACAQTEKNAVQSAVYTHHATAFGRADEVMCGPEIPSVVTEEAAREWVVACSLPGIKNGPELFEFPKLSELRRTLCEPFGVELCVRSKVSLLLYEHDDGRRLQVLQNFNDESVDGELILTGFGSPCAKLLSLPHADSGGIFGEPGNNALRRVIRFHLEKRALLVIGTRK